MIRAVAVAAALAVGACGAADRRDRPVAEAELSVRQAIGQRFVFPFAGTAVPRQLRRRIERGEAAGVILFSRNVRSVGQVRRLTRSLQAIRRPPGLDAPLLVVVDQEGGPVRRIPGAPRRAAAAVRTRAQARADGAAAGRLLRRAGVNLDLAPVADVGRAGSAMRRERRAYPGGAQRVARLAGAFAGGLRGAGVVPAYKHFPGFGAATANTDDARVRIGLSLATLRRIDHAPYRAARDLRAVLLSTAVYPRVDPRPAAFSRRFVAGELRGRLGFGGVAFTDALDTPATTPYGSPAQLAFFALRAGADVPLFATTYATAARAATGLERAVRDGALPRAQLDAGARRVLALRASLEP